MKITLVAVNSRHIHTTLGVRFIKAALEKKCPGVEVKVVEENVNQPIRNVVERVYATTPDVIGFSAYIFNIESVLKIASDLKKSMPEAKLIFGGPEVSYAVHEYLSTHKFIDYLTSGEGEEAFCDFIQQLQDDQPINVSGVWTRKSAGEIVGEHHRLIKDLDSIPSPYDDEMLENAAGRIAYFESSRGCPFNCSYCLSSAEQGVRYFSIDRVKTELTKLIQSNVKQVKFVDRTFNANPKRAAEIIKYIVHSYQVPDLPPKNFHFEVAPDLFNEELFDVIAKVPPGLIQFEAGLQSFSKCALDAVNRRVNVDVAIKNLTRLVEMGNVHLHVGLIAGLPGENWSATKDSFNQAYALSAHQLQLGFLKLLPGTPLYYQAEELGYKFSNYPPYQLLSSNSLTFEELGKLTKIEGVLDRLYNSGKFHETLKYLVSFFDSYFDLYEQFADYLTEQSASLDEFSLERLYFVVKQFVETRIDRIDESILCSLMVFDYLQSTRTQTLPKFLFNCLPFEAGISDLIKKPAFQEKYLPHWRGRTSKQMIKEVYLQKFPIDIELYLKTGRVDKKEAYCLFDYSSRDRVSGYYIIKAIAMN